MSAGLLDAIENNEQQMTGEDLLRELAARANFADVDAFVGHAGSSRGNEEAEHSDWRTRAA